MPALANPKHEAFARNLAKGMDATDAYEAAGFKRHRGNASALRAKQNIASRVRELVEAVTERAVQKTAMTREWVLEMLRKNVEMAMSAEPVLDAKGKPTGEYRVNGAVANKGLELIGKELHGMFVERVEKGGPGDFERLTDDELRHSIARELGSGRTFAPRANGSRTTH